MIEKYLLPEPDGLPTRPSQDYVLYKLKALSTYLKIAITAVGKKWPEIFYIDLQAGPGKNDVGNSVVLGSPLIALTTEKHPTQFRFNELDPELKNALDQRISASPLKDRVKSYQADVNEVIIQICDEIRERDRLARVNRQPSVLNIAFLDPEGLELHWVTVEQLASMNRMDLIINFSTQGIIRNIGAGNFEVVNRFFGTDQWREIDKPGSSPVARRRVLIDFYRQRLEKFGYHIKIDPELGGDEIAISNSKNSQIYSLIFASKHPIADKFWKEATKNVKQPRLLGF
ncbi:MAG: three-Cys-motif partner protein TcmP [Chloroflexi bacterium]|nr:three-Cys-motif partner protein TcmP [Chloroflexota bacterium]